MNLVNEKNKVITIQMLHAWEGYLGKMKTRDAMADIR